MPTCWAVGCANRSGYPPHKTVSGELVPASEKVSFHILPLKNPDLLSRWLLNIGRTGCVPRKTAKICSLHFLPLCFETDFYAKYMHISPSRMSRRPKILKSSAIPTEFSHLQTSEPSPTSAQGQDEKDRMQLVTETSEPSPTSAQGQDEKDRMQLVTEGPSPVKKKRVVTVKQAEETHPITDVLKRKILNSLSYSIPCKKKNVADADIPTASMVDVPESPGPTYSAFVGSTPKVKKVSLISGTKQTVTVPASSIKPLPMRSAIQHQVNCYNQAKIKPPETSGCNLYSTIKTEPFVDPTLENVSSREVTLSHQFCKLGDQVKNEPPETSGCNLYSTIKTEPFVDPTLENVSSREVTLSREFCKPGDQVKNEPLETSGCNLHSTIKTEPFVDPTIENVSSREVTLSRQFCKPGDQVKIEPPQTSGCNLYSTIKIEQFVDPTLENVSSGDVTPSVQFCKPGDITLPKNLPVSPCQSTDEALHVSQSGTATATKDRSIQIDFEPSPEALHVSRSNTVKATKDISVQTDFDPSPLIVIDPSRVMVLDPSQVSDLHPSLIPGFNPADIPGFDPSQIPGYDPSQKYRAVYVNWKERVCGEPVEAMDGDHTETSDPQMRNELEQSPLQKLMCSLENVKPNIEEVILFTETIQAARDQVVEALDSLKVQGSRSNDRQEFVLAMETMVEAASNNVLNMIKQLANTTRQQQTQFIHLAGFVQKIKKEQGEMEEELLKFRRVTLKVRCVSKRKRTLAPEYRKTKFRKNNIDSYTDISKRQKKQKTKENVQSRQMNTNDCSKIGGEQKSQFELCLSLPGPLETSVRHEFQNNRQSKDDRLTIKQIDNCSQITLLKKPEPSFQTNPQEFLSSNETDFQKDCG